MLGLFVFHDLKWSIDMNKLLTKNRVLALCLVGYSASLGIIFTPSSILAGTVTGSPITTDTSLCNLSASARTDVGVVSPGAQPQVGQTFHLLVTVVGVNACLSQQSVGVNLQLPTGVEVDPTGTSTCIRFNSANPADTLVTPCSRSSVGDGFQRVDPQNANAWTLVRGGLNTVQVQLAVRATTAGQKFFSGRICDGGSTVICQGSPVANAIPFVEFSVAAPTFSRNQLRISQNRCLNCLSITTTSINVMSLITRSRPAGIWQIQKKAPSAANFSTIKSRNLTAGSEPTTLAATATGLSPAMTYHFRACFTPAGGRQVCTANIELSTKAQ